MNKHEYHVTLQWTGNKGSGTFDYRAYDRKHIISSIGKTEIQASSDPNFRGDKGMYNPEELLVASVSSCHMLWFLHLCSNEGIIVIEYSDKPIGTMEEEDGGKGKFTEIILRPNVIVSEEQMITKAIALHKKANEYCYIANSLNCPVKHEGVCGVKK